MPEATSRVSLGEIAADLRSKVAVGLVCGLGFVAAAPTIETAAADTPAIPVITKAHKSDFNGKAVPISSEPSGYPIGNGFNGNTVEITLKSYSGDWVFGRIGGSVCGWIEADTLNSTATVDPNGPCKPYFGILKDFSSFGKGLNGDEHEFVDGTFGTPLSSTCNRKAYYNYGTDEQGYNNMNYPSESETGFTNYAGKLRKGSKVHYRYTTSDGEAAVIRDDRLGWVFVNKKDCIDGYPQGGPTKTSTTVPGANPNSSTPSAHNSSANTVDPAVSQNELSPAG